MKLRSVIFIIALLALLVFFFSRKNTPEAPQKQTTADTPTSSNSPGTHSSPQANTPPSQEIDPTNTDPRFTRFLDGRIHWQASFEISEKLHQAPSPASDLQLVNQLLSQYRLIYKENPVGTENAEIIAHLLGKNPKKIFFLDSNHPALSQDGELLDRWGSPFVFHSLKADLMDIRSLGPDRKLWTDDDLSLDYESIETRLQL